MSSILSSAPVSDEIYIYIYIKGGDREPEIFMELSLPAKIWPTANSPSSEY